MVNKELKKLSRRELVDIIYQLKKSEQQLQEEIKTLQEALQDKRIRLSTAGSVAEAAASVTGLFFAAQQTADVYLHEIACMKEETEQECAKMLREAGETAAKVLADSEKQLAALRACCQTEYKKLQQLREEIQVLEENA